MKKCSLCGEKALEGIEICPECLKKAAVGREEKDNTGMILI